MSTLWVRNYPVPNPSGWKTGSEVRYRWHRVKEDTNFIYATACGLRMPWALTSDSDTLDHMPRIAKKHICSKCRGNV